LGVKDGVRLMAAEVVSVTRTTIRAQTKVLREVADTQAAEEALEARSSVGMSPFTAVPAV
jgi:heme exporter protein D